MTLFYELPGGSIITTAGKEIIRLNVANLHPSEAAQIMDAIMNALEGLEEKWREENEHRQAQLGLDLLRASGVKLN